LLLLSIETGAFLFYGSKTQLSSFSFFASPFFLRLVAQMNCYQPETRNAFEGVLGWLHQWACARSYGLGSKLPWDPQFLVESLSDSTIYMAYYTIAHHLQDGVEDGSKIGPLGIQAEQLTDEVWDYILGDVEFPSSSQVPKEKLEILRREFQYFYPFDVRSSGKDLIPNHLSFCVYNHAALFPEKHWPRSMRINGHLMLNGKKMAKSTGNSLTMSQAVSKFGADATRLCLADAGDAIEDANFEEKTANANILRLFNLLAWSDEVMTDKKGLRTGPKDSFWDQVFENEINQTIALTDDFYSKLMYREAIKTGFYEFQTCRDLYRDATVEIGMHAELVEKFISAQALLAAPIAPHFSEQLWRGTLKNESSIQNTRFPEPAAPVNDSTTRAAHYVRGLVNTIRGAEIAVGRKKKGKNTAPVQNYNDREPKELSIYLAESFPEWQSDCAEILKNNYDEKNGVDDKKLKEDMTKAGFLQNKKAMPFVQGLKVRLPTFTLLGTSDLLGTNLLIFSPSPLNSLLLRQKRVLELGAGAAFDRSLPFDEKAILEAATPYLKRTLNFGQIHILSAEESLAKAEELEGKKGFAKETVEVAEPGHRELLLRAIFLDDSGDPFTYTAISFSSFVQLDSLSTTLRDPFSSLLSPKNYIRVE